MERILGLDVGTKTIGIAVSDPLGYTAQPVTTIRRTKPAADFDELRSIIEVYNASLLVVGYPRNMNGTVGEQAQHVDRFVQALRAQVTLPVELEDERLTSRMAQQAMIAGNVKASRRREIIDQQAAALILQSYMDRLSRQRKE